jgi:hypothetical protein
MKYVYRCSNCDKTEVDELQYSVRPPQYCCDEIIWYSDKQAKYLKENEPDLFRTDRLTYMNDLIQKTKREQKGSKLEKILGNNEPLILPIIKEN